MLKSSAQEPLPAISNFGVFLSPNEEPPRDDKSSRRLVIEGYNPLCSLQYTVKHLRPTELIGEKDPFHDIFFAHKNQGDIYLFPGEFAN